jgi:hypothetical protein
MKKDEVGGEFSMRERYENHTKLWSKILEEIRWCV